MTMKISYFCYAIKENDSESRYILSLADIFEAFLNGAKKEVKLAFKKNGENLFLMPTAAGKGMYLFGMTRSDEVIKKIDTNSYTATEIYELLGKGENIGFASYVFPRDNFFAFGSTIMAPKIGTFIEFFNALLQRGGLSSYEFIPVPLLQEVGRDDVLKMGKVGRATISLEKNNSLAAKILALVNAGAEDLIDLDGFDIVIKPRRKKNIKGLLKKIDSNLGDLGIDKYVVKAADELDGFAMDYYLVGKGSIYDIVDVSDEQKILLQVNGKIQNNKVLQEKVRSHYETVEYRKMVDPAVLSLCDANSWSAG